MSEWLKEHAWNACKVQAFEGSNPFLSAIFKQLAKYIRHILNHKSLKTFFKILQDSQKVCPKSVIVGNLLPALRSLSMCINGENFTQKSLSLMEYLELKGLNPALIALELNGKIIPKDEFEKVVFKQGDKVEILSFVGGG